MAQIKELIEFDKIAAGLAEIQAEGNFIPNTETKEGYEASKRFVLDVTTPTRTKLAAAHKEAKAYWLSGGSEVDKKKNEILQALVDIQQPHQDAYKAKDQEEKDKKAKFEADLQDKINEFYEFKFLVDMNVTTSEEMASIISSCGEIDTVTGFYHRQKEAEIAKQDTMLILNDCLISIVNREAEQQRQAQLAEENRLRQIEIGAQQERMRLQQEEMDRKQVAIDNANREIELKAQAEIEEKQRLIDDALRMEKEKAQAIEREKYAKEQAELAAKAAIEAEQQRQYNDRIAKEAAQAKLEADEKHVGNVRGEIKDHIMQSCGVDEKLAVSIVKSLLKIKNLITINY